jgi:hypothetical protein
MECQCPWDVGLPPMGWVVRHLTRTAPGGAKASLLRCVGRNIPAGRMGPPGGRITPSRGAQV